MKIALLIKKKKRVVGNIRSALDNDKLACGIFVDLQKSFDTVDHKILLKKLEHYGIRGIGNLWFKSYLKNRLQSGYDSTLKSNSHGALF